MNKDDFIFSTQQLINYLQQKRIHSRIPLVDTYSTKSNFSLLIPKYYLDLIDWNNPQDPLAKMVLMEKYEYTTHDYEIVDPIGDKTHSPVPGIIHRYPDRCLLMLTNMCAVHCRFCFRKNILSTNSADFHQSMTYIEEHKELWEVILSGGDPFMLTDHFLQMIIDRLNNIEHIKVVRFHTRTTALYPMRLTQSFVNTLKKINKQCVVVTHINHPREITAEFIKGINSLKEAGAMLLSQTVLLKDVNNESAILAELFKRLVEVGIKPYYLHHLDFAAGTHHFRVSIKEGKNIIQKLRGNISGVCIPEYVIDTPGGYGKIPVSWFTYTPPYLYKATSFEGKEIEYIDPIKD